MSAAAHWMDEEDAFPDYEPHEADTLCQGCQEVEAEPYESYCDECLGVIADAAGDLCSVPTAPRETQCKDCGRLTMDGLLGRCTPCDKIKFPYVYKDRTPAAPPILPFAEEATSHPRVVMANA